MRNDLRDHNPVVFLIWSYCFSIKAIIKAYRKRNS
jgi:hypothetical protein